MYRYLSRTVAALAVAGLSLGLVACSNADDAGPAETPGRVVTVPAGGDPSSSPSTPPTSPAPETSESNSPVPSTPAGTDRDLRSVEVTVTWQEAVAAAQEKFDGELTSVTLGWERGTLVYSVDLESDSQEYEADVDPTTGEVLRDETDNDRDDDRDDIFDPADVVVDVADAMKTALAEVEGPVTEWQLEKDDGHLEFTFEIGDGSDDVDVIVDATTGKFVRIDD